MVKHIWHSCTKLHIPVIVIPSLRLILKETIGFPSVIMGFKRVSLDNPLNRIYGIICELSKNFTCESYPYVETITLDDTIVESTEETGDTTPKTKKRDVYLYRTDSTVRCFAPPKSANCNDANSLEWNSDFIEFSEDMDITENISQNTKVDPEIPLIRKAVGKLNRRLANNERKGSSYLPVNIKRLQSNPRRKKI